MADAKIRLSVDGAAIAKSEIDKVNASLGGLGGGADLAKTALAGLAGTITAGAFLGMIRGAIDSADKLNDLSKSTGLAIETLSGLKLASKQSGADLDGTAASINKLSVNIGKNTEKFAALGVTAKDPLEAFKQLSDVFKNIDDPQLRAAVGAEALGKSWASAAPLLMAGSQEIQEMVDKGAKLSNVNTEMAEQADAFNDKLAELTGTGGLMNSMTASLLPLLNLVADELLDMHKNTDGANDGFSILAETFRAVVVLGGNVAFVFKGVGREIGGVAAQLAAFGTGDFKGALAIGDMMKSDAAQARKDFDAWEAKALTAGKAAKNAYSGYTSGQNEPRAARDNSAARGFLSGGAAGAGAEKVSEYQRLQQEITKVIAVQDLELLQGGKLAASSKYQTEELQKITFAFSTHKISQQERIKLIEMTTTATAKMLAVEKQAVLIKNNQEEYAQSLEFAKELAESEVSLSKAREQGRAVLAEYSQSIDAENAYTALEISLVGETEEAKKKAIALYRIEIGLKKQLAAIDANAGFDSAQRAEATAAAQAAAASARAGVSSRIQLEAAEKAKQEQIDIWKQIDSTAESVFMDIAKNGTSAFKHLEDELKNGLLKLLYEMMAKPFIIKIGTEMTGLDLGSLMGGGGGSNPLMKLAGDSVGEFVGTMLGGGGAYTSTAIVGAGAGAGVTTTTLAGIEAASAGLATVGTTAAAAGTATVAAGTGVAGMATAALAAVPVVGWLAAGALALFAIFGDNEDKIPTVLNDLSLFNNSLVGLPFLELSLSSDDAAQGLRDVLYGLENASPTMRKLAGETISLSQELLVASGDIAGARNLARNLGTRGMNEEEVAVYDYNQGLRDQIEAHRAGAAAAQSAASAENQLSQTRYALANKLNVLLGRQTQLQADRAAQLVGVTDATVLSLTNLTFTLEDLHSAVDKSFEALKRSVNAEKEQASASLKTATDIASALKTAKEAMVSTPDRASAQAQLAMFVAVAKASGSLPSVDALKPLLTALTNPSENLFSSMADFQRDFFGTARDIAALSGTADAKVSLEQQNIDRLDAVLVAAQSQIDVLKGIDTSVISVESAVRNFAASMSLLTAAQAATGSITAVAPTTGGGGGGYGGGYSDPTAGMNREIVAAYLKYYDRNPDKAGHDAFAAMNIKGDLLSQTILHASVANKAGADYKTAISRGYDPNAPVTATRAGTASVNDLDFGSFAAGYNNLPTDAIVQVHKGEDIVPRPYVDLQASSRTEANQLMARLLQSNEALRAEVASLKATVQEGNKSAKTTADALGAGARPLTVKVAA